MAANLSPEYLEAERDYRNSVTPAEKISALERMLATIPKHKGTEKLQADLKRKLSQARKDGQKKGGAAHAIPFYQVHKEGAGQVALIGPPNTGKSQLLASLTHAHPEIAEFPFTTHHPTPGMMTCENVQIQLVDLPPLSPDFMQPWIPQAIRQADASVLVADPTAGTVLDDIEFVLATLEGARLAPPRLLAGTKIDLPGAPESFAALAGLYGDRFPSLAVSALTGANLEGFKQAVFALLDLVRVYTRAPGKPADLTRPFVLPRGGTVEDAARLVHRDFAEHLKYARLYHVNRERDGLMVERSHVVEDEDILEFHI
ncbi:MAG: 50S ribosome-binding GTPase [Acidobacteria bacterium]|nr:50S ribosome-binding GTPase [Acidobacteriota bacterium]